jgi:STAS domain
MPKTSRQMPIEIELLGVLDLASANRIVEDVQRAGADAEIRVDLSFVREIHDDALAVVSGALSRAGARASIRGLRRHQLRLLRYLGAEPSTIAP